MILHPLHAHTHSNSCAIPTVFDLGDVPHHNLRHRNLDDLALANDGEFLLLLDAALQPPELLLFAPVVKGRYQDYDNDREENSGPLDPASLGLAFVLYSPAYLTAF